MLLSIQKRALIIVDASNHFLCIKKVSTIILLAKSYKNGNISSTPPGFQTHPSPNH
jgi:hypothetical protein